MTVMTDEQQLQQKESDQLRQRRANFEELEWRTAKRVLEFYEARRTMLAQAPLPAAEEPEMQAAVG